MVLAYFHNIREGFKKIVEESAKSPPPFLEKKLLARNDLHVMKQIPYDTGPLVVARWPLERVLKLRKPVILKRPPLQMGKNKFVLGHFECFSLCFS